VKLRLDGPKISIIVEVSVKQMGFFSMTSYPVENFLGLGRILFFTPPWGRVRLLKSLIF